MGSANRNHGNTVAMTEAQRASELKLRVSADELIGTLRVGPGMDERAYSNLRDALIEFGAAWQKESMLPKSAVNLLVDLFSWVDSSSQLYSGEEAARIG